MEDRDRVTVEESSSIASDARGVVYVTITSHGTAIRAGRRWPGHSVTEMLQHLTRSRWQLSAGGGRGHRSMIRVTGSRPA